MIFKNYPALSAEVAGNFRTVEEAVKLSFDCIQKFRANWDGEI